MSKKLLIILSALLTVSMLLGACGQQATEAPAEPAPTAAPAEPAATEEPAAPEDRITSYNVCYTKLLRFARNGSPIAPSSIKVLARTYLGANNSSSA